MMRYRRLWPPPRWRIAIRPLLSRPPERVFFAISALCGRSVVTSLKSLTVWNRRPADVGLNVLTPIVLASLEELDRLLAGDELDVGLLPVRPPADAPAHPLHLP